MTGVLDYFPAALAEVARVSKAGNDQHNPGQPLHWAREKSNDQADTIVRHLMERGTRDTDGQRHSAKAAWRALALLQTEIEAEAGFDPLLAAEIEHVLRFAQLIPDLPPEVRNLERAFQKEAKIPPARCGLHTNEYCCEHCMSAHDLRVAGMSRPISPTHITDGSCWCHNQAGLQLELPFGG